jgi:hypothetical protein
MNDEPPDEGSDPRTPLPLIAFDEEAMTLLDAPPSRAFTSSPTPAPTKTADPPTISAPPSTTSGDPMIPPNRIAYRPPFWLVALSLAILVALATVGCCVKRGVVPTDPPPPPPKKALER